MRFIQKNWHYLCISRKVEMGRSEFILRGLTINHKWRVHMGKNLRARDGSSFLLLLNLFI